jgi:sugar O-acyltransferase (sialic acid O-acetyltransferase NeuD family)
MENPVIIFGAGSLGIAALDIFNRNGVVVYCFLDDNEALKNTEIDTIQVASSTDDDGYLKFIGKKCEAFIAVEGTAERENLVEMLNESRGVQPVNAVHDTAIVSEMAEIGHGNFVGARAIINAKAKVGSHCIIQSGAIVEATAQLEDFVQVGTGTNIGAGVSIGEKAFIGSGVTIVAGIKIGSGARIGAGSVVVENVAPRSTVFGNPAKKV